MATEPHPLWGDDKVNAFSPNGLDAATRTHTAHGRKTFIPESAIAGEELIPPGAMTERFRALKKRSRDKLTRLPLRGDLERDLIHFSGEQANNLFEARILSVTQIDHVGFKPHNSVWYQRADPTRAAGTDGGDLVLKMWAHATEDGIAQFNARPENKNTDTRLYRVGGDEFTIISSKRLVASDVSWIMGRAKEAFDFGPAGKAFYDPTKEAKLSEEGRPTEDADLANTPVVIRHAVVNVEYSSGLPLDHYFHYEPNAVTGDPEFAGPLALQLKMALNYLAQFAKGTPDRRQRGSQDQFASSENRAFGGNYETFSGESILNGQWNDLVRGGGREPVDAAELETIDKQWNEIVANPIEQIHIADDQGRSI